MNNSGLVLCIKRASRGIVTDAHVKFKFLLFFV